MKVEGPFAIKAMRAALPMKTPARCGPKQVQVWSGSLEARDRRGSRVGYDQRSGLPANQTPKAQGVQCLFAWQRHARGVAGESLPLTEQHPFARTAGS